MGPVVIGGPLGDRDFFLLLRFNDRDIVEEYGVVTDIDPCDNRICYAQGQLMRQADPSAQAAVELFESPPGQCGLFVYLDLYPDAASVYLDNEWVGDFFDEAAYYYQTVEPGTHRVTAYRFPSRTANFETGLFECIDGELAFVRVGGQGFRQGDMVLGMVNDRIGRRAVLDRYLAKVEPSGTTRPPSRLKFITPGETAKDQIQAILDQAGAFGVRGPYEMPGGQWWAYDVGTQASGSGLLLRDAFLEPLLERRRDTWGSGNLLESALLLRFDSDGILAEVAQVDELNPCNLDHRICYAEGGRFLRLADSNIERAVRRADLPLGRCGLYVYRDDVVRPSGSLLSISIYLDAIRVFQNLFSEAVYYYQMVEPGMHVVTVEPPPLNPPVSFECTDGELIFVRVRLGAGRIGTARVSSTEGFQALPFRQLAMAPSVDP